MNATRQLRLYGWTLANMHHRQLLGVVERAGRNRLLPVLPIDLDEKYDADPPAAAAMNTEPLVANLEALRASVSPDERRAAREHAASAAAGEVTFMNRTVDVSADPVAWDHPALADLPRLWRLKLHGFEPLRWLVIGWSPGEARAEGLASVFEEWVADWLERHPVGESGYLRRAWTPYAVSKRLSLWSRFAAWQAACGKTPSPALRAGIRKNVDFLAANVEHDVGGNHVVENGVALALGGTLVSDGDLRRRGLAVLADAAGEQFLSDGGHYERSPMYHVQVLSGYLTVLDLCHRAGRSCPEAIRETARNALAHLAALTPPDDRIPLLNDAVFGETLSIPAVRAYADRIDGVEWPSDEDDFATAGRRGTATSEVPPEALPDSGYYWLGEGENRLLVDGGPVGPSHLPGHSHNDLLAVLLWIDGQRVVADTGTFSYEPGERRQYARGVRGHSTVQVGDREPIELGRRFLMGERTEPDATFRPGPVDAFKGAYTAHCGHTHTRRVYGVDSWWLVWDRVTDAGPDPVASRVSLHPDVGVDVADPSEIPVTGPDGDPLAWIYPLRSGEVTHSDGRYFPEFGRERDRDIVDVGTGRSEAGFGYAVTTDRYGSAALDTDGTVPTSLALGSDTIEVPTV
jgi:uncharacterized heparinase superfamily protein